jgi:pyruvate formate lyase activating enzyme
MRIGGLQKLTLIDYPGKIAATIFVSGCNFRCPFCYNPELVLPREIKKQPQIPLKDVFRFLKERRNLLDGVVLCGGEPTIYNDLPDFTKKIKKMGYFVKLDTNGSNPEMLERMINDSLLDYVVIDIKAPKEKYQAVAGISVNLNNIQKSIDILKEGKVDYEFRTTVVPTLIEKEDIMEIAKWISPAKRYVLQQFRAEKNIDPKFQKIKPYPSSYFIEIQKAVAPFFEICQIRA